MRCKTLILRGCTYCCIVYLIAILFPRVLSPFTRSCLDEHHIQLTISADGHVRNCLTGDVIGQKPKHMSTGPLVVTTDDVPEDTKSRAASFQKVFDKRAWGKKFDASYKDFQASDKITTLAQSRSVLCQCIGTFIIKERLFTLSNK